MSKILAIAKTFLIETGRDKTTWVSLVIVPILLTFIVGMVFGGINTGEQKTIGLAVADNDNTEYSKTFIKTIESIKVYKVETVNEKKARDMVAREETSGAVIIPEGYGGLLKSGGKAVFKTVSLSGNSSAGALSEIIAGLANRFEADAFAAGATVDELSKAGRLDAAGESDAWASAFEKADASWDPAPIDVKTSTVKQSNVRGDKTLAMGFNQSSLGFTITFLMFMLIEGAGTILEERQKNTLARLLSTPTGKYAILAGKMLGLLSTAAIQAGILIVAGAFLFGVNWGREPLPLILIMAASIISMASLGILIVSLLRTTAQMQSLAPVTIMVMAFLGGCYWPIEVTPAYMQTAAKFLPTAWMMQGLVDLVIRGRGWDAVLFPSLVLLAFSAVFLLIGAWRLKLD